MLHSIYPQIGTTQEAELNRLLRVVSESLDLPPNVHNTATNSYEAVGHWLAEKKSPLAQFKPVIYPQGSFALGTVVKPLGRDEFDLDFTCCLEIPSHIDQRQLKLLVGQRLREHEIYRSIMEEKNRCWCLTYANQFHMDIIPAKPKLYAPSPTALLITDKEFKHWKDTDPKAYINWFDDKKIASLQRFSAIESRAQASIEPAPTPEEQRQKTPLQVAVQLIKRHRDVTFQNRDDAPISIIITTLAGHAYQNEHSIAETIQGLARRMPTFIQQKDGYPYIPNPTNPAENFADKWAKHPEREEAFYEWTRQLHRDASSLANIRGLNAAAPILNRFVGEKRAKLALAKFAEPIGNRRQSGELQINVSTGTLAFSGMASGPTYKTVPRNNHFGD